MTYRLYDPCIDLSQFCCDAAEKNIKHRGCITSLAGAVELGLGRYSTRQFLINSGQLFGRTPMKSLIGLGIAMIAGATLGAAGVSALNAQSKPPGYVVVDISEITDAEGYKALGGRSNAETENVFGTFGGKSVSRTDNITALDGTPPKRYIISRFNGVVKAKAWYNSQVPKNINKIRTKTTKSRAFIVEGM